MKKKLLFIINYFYPDVASTGQLMTELCEELQNDFDITVIAAFPNYTGKIPQNYIGKFIVKESYKNVKVLRVKVPEFDKTKKISRIKYILSYFINSIIAIFISEKQDIIFSISQPPVLGGVLGVIAKFIKRAKLVYNIQDFNPEQIEAVGYNKSKLLINILRKIDNYSCKMSDAVVVVGRDMQETLIKRFKGKKIPNNFVINNWADEEKLFPLPKDHPKVRKFREYYELTDKFVIMYSGNLGLYYDLENIIKVMGEYKDREDVCFAFVGEGAVKNKLVEYVKINNINNIKFIPYQSKEDLIYSLNAADVHLVCNAKGIIGVSVPSKIYGVIAVNKPILGILEEGSEARLLIEDLKCGECTSPGNYTEIKKIINKFINNKSVDNYYFNETKIKKSNSINLYKDVLKKVTK